MKAPFPYFGGKSRISSQVWERFGDVARYIEPFAGSLAVLLDRPSPFNGREIVNDSDGLLAMPESWVEVPWRTKGGYASQSKSPTRARENVGRERIWFSPHCQRSGLWDAA